MKAIRFIPFRCLATAIATALVTISLWSPRAQAACNTNTNCRVQPVYGRAPCDDEVPELVAQVCRNDFGSEGPSIKAMKTGADGSTKVTASMPCLLFKVMTFVESSWQMFCASCGSQGLTMIGGGCGYGYSQITTGMRASDLTNNTETDFDVNKVASSATYNLATGLQFMVNKWNGRKAVGDRDPEVIEHWYYTVWAYNSFSWKNNPHNPNYPADRTPWYCAGTSSRSSYPYQEAVWGYMRCPPSRSGKALWTGAEISYPDISEICSTEGCSPAALKNPLPNHKDPCQKGQSGPVYDPAQVSDSDGDGTADAGDCAPNNAAIHPGADDICDGVDNDCDGAMDEGATCPEGEICQGGQCVELPVDIPDAGATDSGVDDAGEPPAEDDAGLTEGDAATPDTAECVWLYDCPDGYVCHEGRCLQDPVLDTDPDDEADHGGATSTEIVLQLSSGCGCHQAMTDAWASFMGLCALLFGFARRRRRG